MLVSRLKSRAPKHKISKSRRKPVAKQAHPEEFEPRVKAHLEKYRPKQTAAAKKDGTFDSQVQSLSNGIADWINSQQQDPRSLEHLSPEQKAQSENTHRM